eukprot:scaffold1410_cov242-Pinguiococcus_pyrenoidosus.AAC.5
MCRLGLVDPVRCGNRSTSPDDRIATIPLHRLRRGGRTACWSGSSARRAGVVLGDQDEGVDQVLHVGASRVLEDVVSCEDPRIFKADVGNQGRPLRFRELLLFHEHEREKLQTLLHVRKGHLRLLDRHRARRDLGSREVPARVEPPSRRHFRKKLLRVGLSRARCGLRCCRQLRDPASERAEQPSDVLCVQITLRGEKKRRVFDFNRLHEHPCFVVPDLLPLEEKPQRLEEDRLLVQLVGVPRGLFFLQRRRRGSACVLPNQPREAEEGVQEVIQVLLGLEDLPGSLRQGGFALLTPLEEHIANPHADQRLEEALLDARPNDPQERVRNDTLPPRGSFGDGSFFRQPLRGKALERVVQIQEVVIPDEVVHGGGEEVVVLLDKPLQHGRFLDVELAVLEHVVAHVRQDLSPGSDQRFVIIPRVSGPGFRRSQRYLALVRRRPLACPRIGRRILLLRVGVIHGAYDAKKALEQALDVVGGAEDPAALQKGRIPLQGKIEQEQLLGLVNQIVVLQQLRRVDEVHLRLKDLDPLVRQGVLPDVLDEVRQMVDIPQGLPNEKSGHDHIHFRFHHADEFVPLVDRHQVLLVHPLHEIHHLVLVLDRKPLVGILGRVLRSRCIPRRCSLGHALRDLFVHLVRRRRLDRSGRRHGLLGRRNRQRLNDVGGLGVAYQRRALAFQQDVVRAILGEEGWHVAQETQGHQLLGHRALEASNGRTRWQVKRRLEQARKLRRR